MPAKTRILNLDELCRHGNIAGRMIVLDILEAGLQAADPYNNTRDLLHLNGNQLVVGNPDFEPKGSPRSGPELYDLDKVGKIYVFGAAKGIQHAAKAFEDVLGDRLTGGHVIAKHGDTQLLQKIGVTYGAHPVPDQGCVEGCAKIIEICRSLKKEDLVFTIVGNGVSALLTHPAPGIRLEDIQKITYQMQIERGAPTEDLNPVRNHLDSMKGGKISRYIQPAQAVHILMFDSNDFIYPRDIAQQNRYGYYHLMHRNLWLHTLPDFTTFADAISMLKKWDLWDKVPESVRKHLQKGNPNEETLKVEEFERMNTRIFGVMPKELGILPTAEKKAIELGIKPYVLSRFMQAEASQAGCTLMDIAKTVENEGKPFTPPCVLLTSGELLVTVGDATGIGGRNQEFTMAAAQRINGSARIVVGAVDTDGTDGPGVQFSENSTGIKCLAGGLIDGSTASLAEKREVNIHEALRQHDTTPALMKLNSGIQVSQNISLGDLGVILIQNNG